MGIFNIKSLKDRYLSNGPTESTQKRQGQESSANEQDPTIKGGVSRLAAIRDSSFHQEMSPDRPPQDPKNPKKRVGEDVQTLLEQSTAAGTDLIEVVTVKPTGDTAPVPTAADHNTAAGQEPAPQDEPADAPAHAASRISTTAQTNPSHRARLLRRIMLRKLRVIPSVRHRLLVAMFPCWAL